MAIQVYNTVSTPRGQHLSDIQEMDVEVGYEPQIVDNRSMPGDGCIRQSCWKHTVPTLVVILLLSITVVQNTKPGTIACSLPSLQTVNITVSNDAPHRVDTVKVSAVPDSAEWEYETQIISVLDEATYATSITQMISNMAAEGWQLFSVSGWGTFRGGPKSNMLTFKRTMTNTTMAPGSSSSLGTELLQTVKSVRAAKVWQS